MSPFEGKVAQTVKNLLAMQEIWIRSLGGEDPLEEGMATHSSILAWRIPMDRGAQRAAVHGVWMRLSDLLLKGHVIRRRLYTWWHYIRGHNAG